LAAIAELKINKWNSIEYEYPSYKVERILRFRDMTPPGWAGWISLDADDSPILMRDRSTQEIYRLDLQFR